MKRQIDLSVNADDTGVLELRAECEDEATSMYVMGGLGFIGLTTAEDFSSALRGEFGESLVRAHYEECESCQRAVPS